MVIAEALARIKDLEADHRRTKEQLIANLFILPDTQKDEAPPKAEEQLTALIALDSEIARLKVAIIETNLRTVIDIFLPNEGELRLNLMQLIKRAERFRKMENTYNIIASTIGRKEARFFSRGGFAAMGEPIELTPNFTGAVKDFITLSAECRDHARLCEQELAKANWRTEVIGL